MIPRPEKVRMGFLAGRAPTQLDVAEVDRKLLLDGQYFEDDPERLVQLRPRLATDVSPYRSHVLEGEMVLATHGIYPAIRCFVLLPPSHRQNTRGAVERAVSWLDRKNPSAARTFRRLMKGELPPGYERTAPASAHGEP